MFESVIKCRSLVFVIKFDPDISGLKYRLATKEGEPEKNYGRVELSVNGVWGTICDAGWDDAEARVVCRSKGEYNIILG